MHHIWAAVIVPVPGVFTRSGDAVADSTSCERAGRMSVTVLGGASQFVRGVPCFSE
jgi:hypothetical protein